MEVVEVDQGEAWNEILPYFWNLTTLFILTYFNFREYNLFFRKIDVYDLIF
jgi:hypothetical protein